MCTKIWRYIYSADILLHKYLPTIFLEMKATFSHRNFGQNYLYLMNKYVVVVIVIQLLFIVIGISFYLFAMMQ